MFDKITFFDTEFANCKNRSICQIALICDELIDGKVVRTERSYLVNPEDTFQSFCVKTHGIVPSDVVDAPAFPEVWHEIASFFDQSVIIGHNVAAADLHALAKNCARYQIDLPKIRYIDTITLARLYCCDTPEDYKLSTLCCFFGIDPGQSHDALCDTRACAELFYLLEKMAEGMRPSIMDTVTAFCPPPKTCFTEYNENVGHHYYVDTDLHPDKKGCCPFPPEVLSRSVPFDGIIDGKSFCLTGDFARGIRKDVEVFISEHGGIVSNAVRKNTDYLLIGTYCSPNYAEGSYGTKMNKALFLQANGANIRIITEKAFFEIVDCGCTR